MEARPASESGRIAVVAGEGRLPLDLATQLAERGENPLVILFGRDEHTAPELKAFDHHVLPLENSLGLIPLLKRYNVRRAVLAGAIVRRPRWLALRPRRYLLPFALATLRGLRAGDDGLLRVVVRMFEENGIRIVGAHELVPDLLAGEGVMTKAGPSSKDRRSLDAALRAARAIGGLDIGQAAVAVGGRVIALEDIEGTDSLLRRARQLRGHGRIAGQTGGVLVKCVKPGQELRADLPTIGPETVLASAEAGLTGIGIEAGRSLVLDKARTIAEADRLGLFVIGLEG